MYVTTTLSSNYTALIGSNGVFVGGAFNKPIHSTGTYDLY